MIIGVLLLALVIVLTSAGTALAFLAIPPECLTPEALASAAAAGASPEVLASLALMAEARHGRRS